MESATRALGGCILIRDEDGELGGGGWERAEERRRGGVEVGGREVGGIMVEGSWWIKHQGISHPPQSDPTKCSNCDLAQRYTPAHTHTAAQAPPGFTIRPKATPAPTTHLAGPTKQRMMMSMGG